MITCLINDSTAKKKLAVGLTAPHRGYESPSKNPYS